MVSHQLGQVACISLASQLANMPGSGHPSGRGYVVLPVVAVSQTLPTPPKVHNTLPGDVRAPGQRFILVSLLLNLALFTGGCPFVVAGCSAPFHPWSLHFSSSGGLLFFFTLWLSSPRSWFLEIIRA